MKYDFHKKEFIESIHKAQFRKTPSYKPLSAEEIAKINKQPYASSILWHEIGIRDACILPYELYVDEKVTADKELIELSFRCGRTFFGNASAGSPFQVYVPGLYKNEMMRVWDYAVAPGDAVSDEWTIGDFENNIYHLRIHGPNGFYREFKGNENDPLIDVICEYGTDLKRFDLASGSIKLTVNNRGNEPQSIEVIDNAYKTGSKLYAINPAKGKKSKPILIGGSKSYNWYDFTVRIKGNSVFERRYAGRVETRRPGKTDPYMGGVI